MIDPHVHLRDWEQKQKETVKHGLDVAYRAGLDAVFEMPNTNPALTSIENIEKRIELADKALKELGIPIFHGLYAGITSNPEQIEEMVDCYNKLFPRVVGFKMYAGHSTGNMGIIEEKDQELVYQTLEKLGFKGVLAVHCEKESLMKPWLWDYKDPFSHTLARPPEAEVESVKDQIKLASEAKYKGTLHICHISVPESLNEIEEARRHVGFRISCGITPHHAMLYDKMMNNKDGLLLKMNPPLRTKRMQEDMVNALSSGRIDWIETDHAPHTINEKLNPNLERPFASGIAGLPYYPHFIKFLKEIGGGIELPEKTIDDLTHNNIVNIFGIDISNTKREPNYRLFKEYQYSAF